jgi:Tfp pilus assembly protein FimT
MDKLNNQRGFATLEIILVAAIIGIFSTIALPKMARILDKAYLDYELKHLYSDLNFARSLGKSSNVNGGIFELDDVNHKIEFWIYSRKYTTASARNRYQIMRPSVTSSPYYRHNLNERIELDINQGNLVQTFVFDNHSRYKNDNNTSARTITLNSRFNYKAYIYLDTVGRISGDYVKRY